MSVQLLDRPDDTVSRRRLDGDEGAGCKAGDWPPEATTSASRPAVGESAMLRVLVVDDNATMRREIRALLEDAGLTVVGEASHGGEGIMLARELRPEVVVMDVRMPILDGIAATGYITRELPDTRVVVFSAFEDQLLAQAAQVAGASCFLIKGAPPANVVAAVKGSRP